MGFIVRSAIIGVVPKVLVGGIVTWTWRSISAWQYVAIEN